MSRHRMVAFVLAVWCAVALAASRADDESSAGPREVPITDAERQHWAYLPLGDYRPPEVDDPAWRANPIDAFVAAALDEQSLEAMPPASKATLLRRVCFDLTGLPPTPERVSSFLADDAPDAYARLVEELLASPAYGERYAQHWLDLARFAETDGFEHDLLRPNAWRYRDWVIDALNRDLPYDEFVRLQLAGDELHPDDVAASVATGFLLCGPDMPDINLQEERRHVVLNEMAATVGSVFLAMQFGCAQCHDHKYDPIRIQDFYRLRAFFESSDIFRDHPIPTAAELAARQAAEDAVDPKFREAAARCKELESAGRDRFRQENPDVYPNLKQILAELNDDQRREHRELAELVKQTPELPELSKGRVMRDGQPRAAHVYWRGDFRNQGPRVDCGFPRVLLDESTAEAGAADDAFAQPRAALADWLVEGDHPLVARVIVNRVWQWHFGVPLAANPSDFGLMGEEPTHPRLLDWLARRFVADGWSFKSLHRLIVTSRTYRLASVPFDAGWTPEEISAAEDVWQRGQAADPANHRLWRRTAMRLDGEAIRDAMLVACEQLAPRTGGPGIRPPLAPEITRTLLKNQWEVTGDDADHRRRSIYLFVRRNLRYPLFDVFDRPDTNASCPLRHESTTATQSLTQLNSEFSLDCARWLAGQVAKCGGDAPAIGEAYLRVFNRPASDEELSRGRDFLARQAQRLRDEGRAADSLALPADGAPPDDPFAAAALVDFCLALFNANEFLYLE